MGQVFYNKTEADLIALLAGWAYELPQHPQSLTLHSGNFGVSQSTFLSAFNNSTQVQAYVEADIQLAIANQVFRTLF